MLSQTSPFNTGLLGTLGELVVSIKLIESLVLVALVVVEIVVAVVVVA